MDKQIIDASQCEWRTGVEHCGDYECMLNKCCDFNCDWYRRRKLEQQLKAKEQECEELKAKFQDMKKSRDIALKEYNEEFEYKRQITVEHLEQKKELLKQLDQLKVENEHLSEKEKEARHYLEEAKKFKNCITEIKEIAEEAKTKVFVDMEEFWKQILQKVSECEVEDEI